MKELKFKTNIKCMGCVNTVKPHLEKVEGLADWSVDLQNPDRVMTAQVESAELEEAVKSALQEAGYSATSIIA